MSVDYYRMVECRFPNGTMPYQVLVPSGWDVHAGDQIDCPNWTGPAEVTRINIKAFDRERLRVAERLIPKPQLVPGRVIKLFVDGREIAARVLGGVV